MYKIPVGPLNFTLWFFSINASKMLGCKLQLLPRTVRDIQFLVPLNAFTTNQCTKASIILKIRGLYIVLNLALEGEVCCLMTLPVCKIIEAVIGHVHNVSGKRRTKNSEKTFFQCHSIYYRPYLG